MEYVKWKINTCYYIYRVSKIINVYNWVKDSTNYT